MDHFLFHIFCLLQIETELWAFRFDTLNNIIYCRKQKKGKVSLNPVRYPSCLTCGMLLFWLEWVLNTKENPCLSLWDHGLSKVQHWCYLLDTSKQGHHLFRSWKDTEIFWYTRKANGQGHLWLLHSLHGIFSSHSFFLLELQNTGASVCMIPEALTQFSIPFTWLWGGTKNKN